MATLAPANSIMLPPGWVMYITRDGTPYYAHPSTRTTQWTFPSPPDLSNSQRISPSATSAENGFSFEPVATASDTSSQRYDYDHDHDYDYDYDHRHDLYDAEAERAEVIEEETKRDNDGCSGVVPLEDIAVCPSFRMHSNHARLNKIHTSINSIVGTDNYLPPPSNSSLQKLSLSNSTSSTTLTSLSLDDDDGTTAATVGTRTIHTNRPALSITIPTSLHTLKAPSPRGDDDSCTKLTPLSTPTVRDVQPQPLIDICIDKTVDGPNPPPTPITLPPIVTISVFLLPPIPQEAFASADLDTTKIQAFQLDSRGIASDATANTPLMRVSYAGSGRLGGQICGRSTKFTVHCCHGRARYRYDESRGLITNSAGHENNNERKFQVEERGRQAVVVKGFNKDGRRLVVKQKNMKRRERRPNHGTNGYELKWERRHQTTNNIFRKRTAQCNENTEHNVNSSSRLVACVTARNVQHNVTGEMKGCRLVSIKEEGLDAALIMTVILAADGFLCARVHDGDRDYTACVERGAQADSLIGFGKIDKFEPKN